MKNEHVSLDTSSRSEATISEQGILTIHGHEAESGNILGQITLNAQETWILLQWLYNHTDMLHQLTHSDQDITTKLRAVDQQSKQRRDIDAVDAEEQVRQDWSNDE